MSTSPRDLIIYGAGGIGREIVSMLESGGNAGRGMPGWRPIAYVDDTPAYHGRTIHGIPCLGPFDVIAPTRQGQETWCHVAVGDNEGRMQVAKRIRAAGWKPATIVHSTAYLSWEVEIGEGCFLGPYVTVSPNVKMGEHVLLNTRSSVGHHAVLGDFSQLSLNASMLGHSRIERGAMVGAHGVVLGNVIVGAWAKVAIGTPVLRSVKPGHTVSLPLAHTIFERKLPEE